MPVSAAPVRVFPLPGPVDGRVGGIGLVIGTCHDKSFPLTVPPLMSVVFPSASCVPVSVPPDVESVSLLRRSPIGVFIVRFLVPSADMTRSFLKSQNLTSREPGATEFLWCRGLSLDCHPAMLRDRKGELTVLQRQCLLANISRRQPFSAGT